jgi:hypothetical protein
VIIIIIIIIIIIRFNCFLGSLYSLNILDLYLGDAWFVSRPLSSLRVFAVFLKPCRKIQDYVTTASLQILPNSSFTSPFNAISLDIGCVVNYKSRSNSVSTAKLTELQCTVVRSELHSFVLGSLVICMLLAIREEIN